jgi:hypothetical protein
MNNPKAEPRSILPQITQIYTGEIFAISESYIHQVCGKKRRNPEAKLRGILLIKACYSKLIQRIFKLRTKNIIS